MVGALTITQGGAGALGAGSVGVDFVAKDGGSATLSIGGTAGGTHWSTHVDVAPNGLLALAGGSYRITEIAAPASGHRGSVSFAPDAGSVAPPADSVVLAGGETVMLGGPEIEDMTAVRVTRNATDSASIEWWPAMHAREDADPASVKTLDLKPGTTFTIGNVRAKVHAVAPSVVLALTPG